MRIRIIFICAIILALSACNNINKNNNASKNDDTKKLEAKIIDVRDEVLEKEISPEVTIGYLNYPSSATISYLAKEILEENGYTVGLKEVSRDKMLSEINSDSIDVSFSCYLPDIDYDKYNKNDKNIKDLGINYSECRVGLYVPKVTDIGFVEELDFYRSKFDRTMYVLNESESFVDDVLVWVADNNINYRVEPISTKELDGKLSKIKKSSEWIVFAGWEPHYLMDKYDLRFLDGDIKYISNPQQMHTIVDKNIEDDRLLGVLQDIKLDNWEMNELINLLHGKTYDNYSRIIDKWIQEKNIKLVNN